MLQNHTGVIIFVNDKKDIYIKNSTLYCSLVYDTPPEMDSKMFDEYDNIMLFNYDNGCIYSLYNLIKNTDHSKNWFS